MDQPVYTMTTISDVFGKLCLPVPSDADMAAIRLGSLVPLEDYGCLIRIETGVERVQELACAAVPIGIFAQSVYDVGGTVVRIVPGIAQTGISAEDHKALSGAFESVGYKLCGGAEDDCGYITCRHDNGRLEKLPVLFDITDIRDVLDDSFGVRRSCGEFRDGEALYKRLQAAQDILYSSLQEKCAAMIEESSPPRKSALAKDFWRAMREATQDMTHGGVPPLSASWKKAAAPLAVKEAQIGSINQASARYAQRLRADALHRAIIAG